MSVQECHTSFALGTAQLGMPYGIANRVGKPSPREAVGIIEAAWDGGVRYFDTAQGYGNAEEVIGCAVKELQIGSTARIISKLHPSLDYSDEAVCRGAIEKSMKDLQVPQLWSLLLHRQEDLDEKRFQTILPFLLSLKNKGLVRYIGVSLYDREWAWKAMSCKEIDVIQVPFNLLDQRMLNSGILCAANKLNKQVFIRSVYLQGLLLESPENLPDQMQFAQSFIRRWHSVAENCGYDKKELLVGYTRGKIPHACVVVGVETLAQVRENVRLFAAPPLSVGVMQQLDSITDWPIDEKIIDPRQW